MRNPDDIPRGGRAAEGRSRSRTWMIVLGIVVVVVVLSGQAIARFYTSYLWFYSVASTDIWSKLLVTKIALVAALPIWLFVAHFPLVKGLGAVLCAMGVALISL